MTCSFDTDGGDCAVGGDEVDYFPVSGSHGQEFPACEGFAVFVDATWCVLEWVSIPAMTFVGSLAKMEIAPQSRRMLADRARAGRADNTLRGPVVSGSYEVMSGRFDTP